jgi:hypothetical protein
MKDWLLAPVVPRWAFYMACGCAWVLSAVLIYVS